MFNLSESIFFKKITGKRGQNNRLDEALEKRVLSDVFYFLCGVNTENIRQHAETGILINPEYTNIDIMKDIQRIYMQTRVFENFIFENEYSDDSLKRIFCSELKIQISDFYNLVVSLRHKVTTIEEFLINIAFFIDLFDEMEKIIQIISGLKGDIIINVIKERMDKMVQFSLFYGNLIEKFAVDINQRIAEFTFEGNLQTQFFMIREKPSFEFKEKFIQDKFKIDKLFVPFYIGDSKLILESGLYSVLIRDLKEKSVFTDNLSNQCDQSMPIITDDLLGFKNIKNFMNAIRENRNIKYQILNNFFQKQLENEWNTIKKYVFILDQSFIADILSDIKEDVYKFNTKNVAKINRLIHCNNIVFSISKSSFTSVISKILNIEENQKLDEKLDVLEGLTIKYTPNDPIKIFFSEKNINEIELIFRMLYTIQVIQHFIVRKDQTKFNNTLVILNNNLISSFYTNKILKDMFNMPLNDFNSFTLKIDELIKTSLRDLYLTSQNVFKIFGKYFMICFKYIKYGTEDSESLKNIISELSEEIDKENYNVFLSNLLFSIKLGL